MDTDFTDIHAKIQKEIGDNMDIKSELKQIQERASEFSEIDKQEILAEECSTLVDKCVVHYYSGSELHSIMEENYPNWKFEAEEIAEDTSHEIYSICENTEFTEEDIFRMAKIECEINEVAKCQSDAISSLMLMGNKQNGDMTK